MKKMVYLARILAVEIRKSNEVFLENVPFHLSHFYNMFSQTKLYLDGNKFINLQDLWEDSELDDMGWKLFLNESDDELLNFCDDKKETEKLAGILVCDNFLYELLYEYAILGRRFETDKKNVTAKELFESINKIAVAFQLELQFMSGHIYFKEKIEPLDDGTFICDSISEVEVLCMLKNGASLMDARELSGMQKVDFELFIERLKQHEWNQTSAFEG